ncbi:MULTISPECIES: pseudouridine synthase [unclassified Synechocystis]|uniref:pseudouridine synthase n=1 Tax=unclassified Synechocystis TaxID=2640012 RepID=UPI0003FEEE1E|nr:MULTISPECIES: pseudouridine synthase [unclassified Synechocystis]AIE72976.1 tRNA pseudouridine synthase A [Synechocystis sp. PCC 6714]MCT0253508.1 pseudouridine synthase [Synechocystis sp. CS-94]
MDFSPATFSATLNKTPQTIVFYKPYGVLCQFTDNSANPRRTLKDYINLPGLYPVGRLDQDSEGLLLLTSNGKLQNRLAHREFAHQRTYFVQVEGAPTDADLEPLRRGITLGDYHTRPASANIIAEPNFPPRNPPIRYRASIPTTWLSLTLTEGRNRQVRRMTAAVGFPTLRLVRVELTVTGRSPQLRKSGATWRLDLENLQPGQWRPLTPWEENFCQQLLAGSSNAPWQRKFGDRR